MTVVEASRSDASGYGANRGDLDGAIAALREGLQVRPHDVLALTSLGVALARPGQTAEVQREALQAFDAALSLQPGFGPALAARAEA